VAVAVAAAEAGAGAADATAGSLKISAKKRRMVGSPLLVLLEPFHFSPLPQSFESRATRASNPLRH